MANKKLTRTKEQIDQEYTYHATQMGHKMHTVQVLEIQIPQHHEKMTELMKESQNLPKEVALPTEEQTTLEEVPVLEEEKTAS